MSEVLDLRLSISTPPLQPNLLDLSERDLMAFFISMGEKPFRAQQLLGWVYRKGIIRLDAMSDLSQSLRQKLESTTTLSFPQTQQLFESQDGTLKWIIRLQDGAEIETVYIPEGRRGTLCLSSQVGCQLACVFCATGKQGFQRNLTRSEILGQVWMAAQHLNFWGHDPDRSPLPLTNIVFMGMGEPMLNFDPVVDVCRILLDARFFNFSKRRVTLSTSGIVPAIDRLIGSLDIALAVSLHAAIEERRTQLMPINQRYPLPTLIEVLKRYQAQSRANRSGITIEYTLLEGINDQMEDARALMRLLKGLPSKINLIPWNPIEGAPFKRTSEAQMHRFAQALVAGGWVVTVRRSRGDDIASACGQLVGKVSNPRLQAKLLRMQARIDDPLRAKGPSVDLEINGS